MTHVHDHQDDSGFSPKTIQSYIVGFSFSLILTLCAFFIVEKNLFPTQTLYIVLAALAVLQLCVQCICFLRLNNKDEYGRWNFLSFLFVILVIAILAGGSLWIMYNLNYNMHH